MFHDDGIYAVTAKSLATGHGYRITSLPTEIAQTKYPILFPALLAVVWKLFPEFPQNLFWLKLVPFACTLVWGVLACWLFREKTGSARVAMALTGWMAASPWVLFLGTALLSETLFAALMTGALVLLGRLERGRGGWTAVAGVAVLSSGAFLTRTVGVTLIIVGGLILSMQGRWRQVAAFALICAALCGPWIWWQTQQHSDALDYEPY
jgi:4-amino-4-deoxy-L-arabinose transferase-like glycosyltransferase